MITLIDILLHKKLIKLMPENLAARLAQVNLANKNDIDAFVKKTDFDTKQKKLNKSYFK